MRSSSPHALSESHSGAGLGFETSPVLMPPVRKKRSSSDSIPSFVPPASSRSPSSSPARGSSSSENASSPSFSRRASDRSGSSSSPSEPFSSASLAASAASSAARRASSSASRAARSSASRAARSSASTSSPAAMRAARASAIRFSSSAASRSALATLAASSSAFRLFSSAAARSSLVVTRNEKSSLSFSNRLRHTLTYRKNVKCSVMFLSRFATRGSVGASSMPRTNKSVNHCSEYWYMSPMEAMSATQKNTMLLCFATGRYPARVASIFASVASATFCFSEISSDKVLDALRIFTAFSSSRMFPSEEDIVCRMRSSISFRRFLLSAEVTTSSCRCDSRSGLSSATTTPRSWSDKPSGVIMKLSSVTFTAVSGR
mmetsp:Transcript_6701/g.27152  ORF Transcript_6701/g.27152 Transcript_6701/m.27152 type:complete len:375 (-) Transcript_6701:9905-11029(-)